LSPRASAADFDDAHDAWAALTHGRSNAATPRVGETTGCTPRELDRPAWGLVDYVRLLTPSLSRRGVPSRILSHYREDLVIEVEDINTIPFLLNVREIAAVFPALDHNGTIVLVRGTP
jgi:hypothetical protein